MNDFTNQGLRKSHVLHEHCLTSAVDTKDNNDWCDARDEVHSCFLNMSKEIMSTIDVYLTAYDNADPGLDIPICVIKNQTKVSILYLA